MTTSANAQRTTENALSSTEFYRVAPWTCDRCKGINLPALFPKVLPAQAPPLPHTPQEVPHPVFSLQHRSFDDLDPECRICSLLRVAWNIPSLRPPYNLRAAVSDHLDGMMTQSDVLSSHGLEISGKHWTEYDAVSMSKNGFPSIKEVSIDHLDYLKKPRIDFKILKSWIERCSSKHDECKETWDHTLNQGMRLVHIKERRIVSTSEEPMPYAALSYVWGADSALPDGDSLPAEIPKTIKDAMDIAKRLGLEYLWVDRYCIPQQDSKAKNDQMSKMHHIYRQSRVTIIAAAGEGADYGIPGMSIPRSAPSRAIVARRLFVGVFGLQQVLARHDESKWASRSWTYQEAILSRRLLYFTDFDTFFRCNQTDFSGVEEPLRNSVKAKNCQPRNGPSASGYLDSLWEIRGHILEIKKRDISRESDRVNVIRGILNRMQEQKKIRGHLSGCAIFSEISDLSGCATSPRFSRETVPPIFPSDSKEKVFETWEEGFLSSVGTHCKDPAGVRRDLFPSWSWAGWERSQATQSNQLPCEFLRDDNVRVQVEIDPAATFTQDSDGMPKGLEPGYPRILSSKEFQKRSPDLFFKNSTCRFIRIEAPILHCQFARVDRKWKVVTAERHRVDKITLDEESGEGLCSQIAKQLKKSLLSNTIKGLVFKRYDGDCLVVFVKELDGYYERIAGWQFQSWDFPFFPQVETEDGAVVPLFDNASPETKPDGTVLLRKEWIRLG